MLVKSNKKVLKNNIYLMDQFMEIMAYVGSVLVFLSFCTKNVKLLRILNNVGCLIFLFYALHNDKMPLIILNSMVILVNIYHLIKGD
jgi:hypothetical protein